MDSLLVVFITNGKASSNCRIICNAENDGKTNDTKMTTGMRWNVTAVKSFCNATCRVHMWKVKCKGKLNKTSKVPMDLVN